MGTGPPLGFCCAMWHVRPAWKGPWCLGAPGDREVLGFVSLAQGLKGAGPKGGLVLVPGTPGDGRGHRQLS